ncbi:FAD/NAD(P)-binding domain-containing protein [Laetiporus sulphureus 93-53]|uniref:FAD/NAD(P)-binding domain-containing protein n=1 Tax=Laetiporus sulphureus 93-53 TaxID=1314785 RepID=A0A165DEU4_9APHY|nr:FAD/NAD(P)-binding domain-containing protein [Laetiporus sulphureus 93-53]KZT04732.1 FAD/NAD(P)-binding domain-containing protein [Laetiporus sulphureus 93-53]
MPSAEPPKRTQVLVIGGGPAGSYAASTLAREGFNVVLFEMAKFPRYHIGESLLPSVRHYLRFIDVEEKIAAYGFTRKPGSAIKFNQYMREGYTDFVALGAENNAWNVVRSEFDHLLLQHSSSSGVRVFEQTRVTEIIFDDSSKSTAGTSSPRRTGLYTVDEDEDEEAVHELGRPTSAVYETVMGGKGEIAFDFLVDASGRAGLMSTKYLRNRRFNESLRNVAVWGYWRGTDMYGAGTGRENAPWFEALSDESGWAWFIPLHKGLTSVGVVMDKKQLGLRSRASSSASTVQTPPLPGKRHRSLSTRTSSTLAERYQSLLQLAPGVLKLIGDGELVGMDENCAEGGEGPAVRSTSDFSYSANTYAGEGFRIIGDAGAFIDPFFSSGVHLALTGGLSAAASISASIRGDCSELEAAQWHSSRVAISYTRFLVVVLSAYKQIRAQKQNVLADVDQGSFDKAFVFLRPVIQGGAEMGTRLSEDELQKALDFCVHLFSPTTPEQHEAVRKRLEQLTDIPTSSTTAVDNEPKPLDRQSKETIIPQQDVPGLLDVHTPIVDPAKLKEVLAHHSMSLLSSSAERIEADAEVKMVLDKVNARRVIHSEHGNGLNSLEEEAVDGFVVRLRRGQLGLRRSSQT